MSDDEDDMNMNDLQAQMANFGMDIGNMKSCKEDIVSDKDVNDVIAKVMASVASEKTGTKTNKSSSKEENNDSKDVNPDFDEGKIFLQDGMKAIRNAVAHDQLGKCGRAAIEYDMALSKFAQALDCNVPNTPAARVKLVESMEGYLNRIQEILIQSTVTNLNDISSQVSTDTTVANGDINKNRLKILQSMGKQKFSCVSRGVALRKRGKDASSDKWTSFVLFSEAIDCFVAYMKIDPKGASNEAVKNAVMELLDAAEKLKNELGGK